MKPSLFVVPALLAIVMGVGHGTHAQSTSETALKVTPRAGEKSMRGAMYVDVWVPDEIRRPYPIVMFHGNGQTGVDWMQTPDGRPGWAYYLVAQGYVLYMMDYPTRGRSAYVPGHDGNIGIRTGDQLEEIWTNVVERSDYYLKDNHTQWPGTGRMGDPTFDTFVKSQVEFAQTATRLARTATVDLLDTIGTPVILFSHSQGGNVSLQVADDRPDLVRGIVTRAASTVHVRSANHRRLRVEHLRRGGG